jgi:predicted CxxxxCH...CXXCH cytochrome family protein
MCHGSGVTTYDNSHASFDGTAHLENGSIGYGSGGGSWDGTRCSNVNCHFSQNTPAWGTSTAACDECHGTPPSTNAHARHYSAKGWASDTSNCVTCHNDNATANFHAVVDGSVAVSAGLSPSGSGSNRSCNSTPDGCHNTKPSPAWNTTGIACTDCHDVGGANTANVANPASGLHAANATSMISGNPHDAAFAITVGDAGDTAGCVTCHTTDPSSSHQDGSSDATIGAGGNSAIKLTTGVGYTDAATPTCGPNGGLNSCHLDAQTGNRTGAQATGPWQRLWTGTVDDTGAVADARCNNCHGTFWSGAGQSFRDSVVHLNTANMDANHGSAGENTDDCNACHAWGDAAYDSVGYGAGNADHGDGQITINDDGTGAYTGWARSTGDGETSVCRKCHDFGDTPDHDFDKTWANFNEVAGHSVTVVCGSCHLDGVL